MRSARPPRHPRTEVWIVGKKDRGWWTDGGAYICVLIQRVNVIDGGRGYGMRSATCMAVGPSAAILSTVEDGDWVGIGGSWVSWRDSRGQIAEAISAKYVELYRANG